MPPAQSGTYLSMLTLAVLVLLPMPAAARPNFVVLLVDDAGLMDFGSFGGEARMPNIDALAASGVRFSNHHTSPLCATSRAMLLTGLNSHRTGVGTIPEMLTESQATSPAYALELRADIETIAERLAGAGYATFMTGKWHLGRGATGLPNAHGFQRAFALDASGADNWAQKSYLPFYAQAPWFEDGNPATLPDDFYSSTFIVDKMIEYLNGSDPDQPFFAYLGFQAIHIPVQAPRHFTDNYRGVYADGWDEVRARRIQRARSLGLLPPGAPAPEPHPALRPWNSLTAEQQRHYEANMMVNAGMLEAMDHHIGRLVAYLQETGALDNTVIIVTSDNGPEFGDPSADSTFRWWMALNGYHTDAARMGEPGFMGAIGPEWASAAAAPSRLFKMYTSEGGTRVPLIISGPGIAAQPGFNQTLNFVVDLAPTIADMAGVPVLDAADGKSLAPLLSAVSDKPLYGEDESFVLEVAGNGAVYRGGYKLLRSTLPHGDTRWRLYDLQNDPAEQIDLSATLPQLKQAMLDDYASYADEVGIVPVSEDFDIVAQIAVNTVNELRKRWVPRLVVIGGIALAVLALLLRRRQLKRRAA